MNWWNDLTAQLAHFGASLRGAQITGRDILDVAVITFLIYLAVRFLEEAHLGPVLVGIVSVFLLYGVSSVFDLPLTLTVLRTFFGIFLILIAIVFQNEIRRFFAYIGFLGIHRRSALPLQNTLDIITRSSFYFARHKMGALIVLPGKESVENFFRGGITLHGVISEPLLISIFDASSPGHDGALVIEHNQVEQFGVHLPLAEKVVHGYGLRHRAALGLSEHSDALIVVVSEEKEQVSIVHKGILTVTKEEKELHDRLAAFYKEKYPPHPFRDYPRRIFQNIRALAVALVLAATLWIFVSSSARFAPVERTFSIMPEFRNIPQGYFVSDVEPSEVAVTLDGRSAEFDSFRDETLRLVVDLSSVAAAGRHQVPINASYLRFPSFNPHVAVIKMEPSALKINLTKEIAR